MILPNRAPVMPLSRRDGGEGLQGEARALQRARTRGARVTDSSATSALRGIAYFVANEPFSELYES